MTHLPLFALSPEKGLGKVRHLGTTHFWTQEVAATIIVNFQKVHGTEHCADLMTKELSEVEISKYIGIIGAIFQIWESRSSGKG